MTYSLIYCALISKRLQNHISKDKCYCETHHIIPKSEGGTDSKYNLVNLTAREHYIAHLLLAKIYNDKKMWFALNRLVHGNNKNYTHVNSRTYQILKENFSRVNDGGRLKNLGRKLSQETIERMIQSKLGAKNPMFGKKRSVEACKKTSMALKGHPGYWRGKKVSDEIKQKRADALRGRKHWNNGIIDVFSVECPDGFVRGKLHKTIPWNKGKIISRKKCNEN